MPFPPTMPPPIPQTATAPIPSQRWARNGLYPDAALQTQLALSLNTARRHRPKEVFRTTGSLPITISNASSPNNRFRFAWHSSPQIAKLHVVEVLAPIGTDNPGSLDAYSELLIKDLATNTLQGTLDVHFGQTLAVLTDCPGVLFTNSYTLVGIPKDTDLYGAFTDNNKSRLVTACIYEESDDPLIGYLDPRGAVGAPISDLQRSELATRAKEIWKRGGQPYFTWTTSNDTQAVTAPANTARLNLVDATSTTVSAATPGFVLDTRYHYTVGSLTSGIPVVPVVIAVFGNRGAGTASQQGILIQDSTGTTVCSASGLATTDGWIFVQTTMPAAAGKFDVCVYNNAGSGGTVNIKAVSMFPYVA